MPIILNTSELFRYQGSGIKSFTQALLRATSQSIPIELLLEAKRKERDSVLAHTNLFNVHRGSTGKAEIFKREIKQSFGHYIPGRSAYKGTQVSTSDPLYALALARVPLETGGKAQNRFSFRASLNIYSNSQVEFVRTGQCSEVSFPDVKTEDEQRCIFHNPLPFPLFTPGIPMIVTVHDLIPLSHSELCLDDPGRFYELLSLLTEKAAAVHAISHTTGDLLIKVLGDRVRSKLKVVQQALVMTAYSEEQEEDLVKTKLDLFDRFQSNAEGHSLLQLGSLEPKKNHATTLEVHRILRRTFPGLKLQIIGKAGWLCEDLLDTLASRSGEGVEWLRSAPRASVRWHLNNSLALMFPSLVEGWGLPPLEAMALGTPAVCSDIPACQEACGEGAAGMAAPHDVTGFCKILTELLSDRERYASAVRAGLRQARLYSQERFRDELMDLYSSVLDRGN
jgi:glycosyltransferase involved in cell wall biosynthesis